MLFNSLSFMVFLVVVIALYYSNLLSWGNRKRMLLFTSYVFYGLWNPPLVIILWLSTIVDWVAANNLAVEENQRKRNGWLALSMVVNLGFLGFFKYGNFLLENFTYLMNTIGVEYQAQPMDIILPMGISFYTFQTMSYTLDVYNRKAKPANTFLDFALYVTFFPQLVAGPIVRAGELIDQFYTEKKATIDQFIWGLFLFTLGLFQKVVLADSLLSDTADTVFSSKEALNFWDAWAGTLAFSGQIFFDFAGYSTCAIGIAMMLGFILPHNFLYPYGAIGFTDFWRRWHITLSTWLRDYLYIPLGGNRLGMTRMYVALMVTMLVGGLWHGAAWTFVVWGALHGFYLVMEKLFRRKVNIKTTQWNGIFLAFLTFTLINFTWVFFRAREFSTAQNMIESMLFLHPNGILVLEYFDLLKVFVLVGLLFLTHFYMRHHTVKMVSESVPNWLFSFVWAVMIFLIVIAQGSGEQFIYFQF
ncbi:MBOAT family O-acyltransferase [Flavobacterium sp.]|uniref:MBOAT family O-acyltransferase n=1 Tax=Flavobacterium sp. TaxID=239 RepID=UPI0025BBAEBA|nr:MBOAT family O-acyltransferase [Flavobacterium sp.]MBA4153504.1 membrane-bound O-acyltransferase family protein [Flavobacterium sp.]